MSQKKTAGSTLSCDPVYRALVSDARKHNWEPLLLGIVSDYREDQGFARLASRAGRLAKKEQHQPYGEIKFSPEQERLQKKGLCGIRC